MASNYVVAGSVGRFLREEFAAISRHMIEDGADPVTRQIVLDTSRVKTSASLGRPPAGLKNGASQFQAIHPVSFGRSGTFKYQALGTLLGMDNPPMLTKAVEYPSATDTPQRSTDWMTIDLKWMLGNLTIDQRQYLALKNGNPVDDFLADWLKDPYTILIQNLTTAMFRTGHGQVGQVAATVTVNANATADVTLSGSVRHFWRGQRVRVFEDTLGVPGATQRGPAIFIVTKVHNFTATPTVTLHNTTDGNIELTATDWIVMDGAWDGTTSSAVLGLSLFTDNTAAIHGLSKSDNPELLSYVDVPVTARNPTPLVFQKAYDAIFDRGFKWPDMVVTTRGVRSLYYQQEGMFKSYNTELSNPVQRGADGGMTGQMQFTTEEGVVPFVISAFCPKGLAFPIRLDALVRYAPNGMDAVQFLGDSDLLGGNMFMPSVSSNHNYTSVFEAPFAFFYENGCTEPQCLARIGNLNELADVYTA